jgi:long-chain acyl-CoA synthetase
MTDDARVGMTLNYLVDVSCEKHGDLGAIGMAGETPLTYRQLHERICAMANQLLADGAGKGDHIAILASNSHHWAVAYLGLVRIGAVAVPILPDLPEADVHHILTEMKVKTIFTTAQQIEKLYEMGEDRPERIITLDDHAESGEVLTTISFSAYMETALTAYRERIEQENPPDFPEVAEDDLASILYTSGTSGFSKAVMLTHKNLTANAYALPTLMDIGPGSVFLSILPMSHTYEFTAGFILPLIIGARIAYAGKTPTPAILQNLCGHEKPHMMFAVPLVLEKIYKKRVLPKVEKSTVMRLLYKTNFTRRYINRKIGAKLKEFFGGNLLMMGIGGAALNPEVEQFLVEAKFPYLTGYGLTEASPLIAGGPFGDPTIALGSVGKPIPGVQVKIDEPDPRTGVGEILARGPNIMRGYYNDEEATAETITADGWLSTGDLGVVDEAGNLHVKGRCKNVIVMSSGENVYPEPIEHKINSYQWVAESLVLENNGRLDAWIYPDYEVIDELTAGQTESQRRVFLHELLETMRHEINTQLAVTSKLAKVFERREPFIKTATHKIKRYLYDGHAKIS